MLLEIQAITYTVQPPFPTQPIKLYKLSTHRITKTPGFLCSVYTILSNLTSKFFDDDQHVRLALHPHTRSPRLGCRSVHHHLAYQRDLLGEYSFGLSMKMVINLLINIDFFLLLPFRFVHLSLTGSCHPSDLEQRQCRLLDRYLTCGPVHRLVSPSPLSTETHPGVMIA